MVAVVDRDEAMIVAQAWTAQLGKRIGNQAVIFAQWERTSPRYFNEVLEDACAVIRALDKHRGEKYMAWMHSKPGT